MRSPMWYARNKWSDWLRSRRLFKQVIREMDNLRRSMNSVLEQNAELRERIPAIAQRLAQVSVQESPAQRHIRIVVELDCAIIDRGFLHGNDALMIDYIGQDIGRRAAIDIRRANFQRWET